MMIAILWATLISLAAANSEVFVSSTTGNDTNSGLSAAASVATLSRAASLVASGAAGGNATIVLADGEVFGACSVSVRASGSLRLVAGNNAVVSCAQRVNASAAAAIDGVFEIHAAGDVVVVNVTFRGFNVWNASGVLLSGGASVRLQNVSVLDNAINTTCLNVAGVARVVRAPLVAQALLDVVVADSRVSNNSLTIVGSDALSSARGFAPLLAVPGGGGLALVAERSVTVSDCVFDRNEIDAENTPYSASAVSLGEMTATVCGGGLLALGEIAAGGSVVRTVFERNGVRAASACGGAVGVSARNFSAAIVFSVTNSTMSGNWLAAKSAVGGSVALVGDETSDTVPPAMQLQLHNVSIAESVVGAFDSADLSAYVVKGGAASAFWLVVTDSTIVLSNTTSSTINGGLLSGMWIVARNVVMSDNSMLAASYQAGGAIGTRSSHWCSAIFAQDVQILRTHVAVARVTAFRFVTTECHDGMLELGSLYNATTSLVGVVIADTSVDHVLQFGNGGLTSDFVSLASKGSVVLRNCVIRNSAASGSIVRADAVMVQLESVVVENCTSEAMFAVSCSFSTLIMRLCALSSAMSPVLQLIGTESVFMFHSSLTGNGKQPTLILGSPVQFSSIIIQNVTFVDALISMRTRAVSVELVDSQLLRSQVVVNTAHDADQGIQWSVHDSVFVDSTAVVFDDGISAPSLVEIAFANVRFESHVQRWSAPIVKCVAMALLDFDNCTVVGESVQPFVFSACQQVYIANSRVDGTGGIEVAGGDLAIVDSLFEHSRIYVHAGQRNMTFRAVRFREHGPIAIDNMDSVELFDLVISDVSQLREPALSVSQTSRLWARNVTLTGLRTLTDDGVVDLRDVDSLRLEHVLVENCTAPMAAGFHVTNVRASNCSDVVARDNVAEVAGGAALIEDTESMHMATHCIASEQNAAGAYGPDFVSRMVRLVVNDGDAAARAMPGVGLRGLRVSLVDAFNVTQRRGHTDHPLRASRSMSVSATVACVHADGTTTTSDAPLCTMSWFDDSCSGDLALPVANSCAVTLWSMGVGNASLTVWLRECAFGFGVESNERPVCVPCALLTTSVGGRGQCRPCPMGARCCGTDRVFATPGHFLAIENASLTLSATPCLSGACVGSDASCSTLAPQSLNRCAPFRVGLLCAHCNETRLVPVAPTGDSGAVCIECAEAHWLLVALVVAAVAACALIVHINSAGSSAALKILLYYTQLAGLQAPPGLFAAPLVAFFGFKMAAATGSFGGVCVAPLDHFGLVAVRVSLPLVMMLSLVVIGGVARLIGACRAGRRRRQEQHRNDDDDDDDDVDDSGASGVPQLSVGDVGVASASGGLFGAQRLLRTSVAIVLITYSVLLAAALDVLHCVTIGNESVLVADVRESCDSAEALGWQRAAIFGLLPAAALLVAGLPVAVLALRRANGGRVPEKHAVLGVLFESYAGERARIWWESFVLLRRAVVGGVVVFVASAPAKHVLFTAVNVASLAATLVVRPFADRTETQLDIVAQIFLTLLGCAVFDEDDLGLALTTATVTISAVPAVLIGAFMLRAWLRKVVNAVRAWRLRRIKQ
jgi:hypothetical protein